MKKSSKRILIISLTTAVVLSITACIFWDYIVLEYYNIRDNHAKVNDKLYPANWMRGEGHDYTVTLYRIARNAVGDKIAVDGGWKINGDSLARHHSNFIGYYKGYKMLNNEFGAKMLFYEIGTNKLGLERINYESEIKLPKGYQFTNDPFHVISFEVTDKQ